MNWIDFLAILPNLIGFFTNSELAYDKVNHNGDILKLFRIFRLFHLSRYFHGIKIFARAINASKIVLGQLFVFILVVAAIFATLIYYIERYTPAPSLGSFDSILDGIWWALVTMTTLGYGDMVPESGGGKDVVCEQQFALEADIGSHACWVEASTRVANSTPPGAECALL